MDFLKKMNHDEVFWRGLLVGLIGVLNDRVTIPQVGDDNIIKEHFIPFFPSLVGDEPFLQDNFLKYEDCDGNPIQAEFNYDSTPRGIVEMGACTIDTTSSTNKYVRATYTKEIPNAEGGAEMKAYSSYLAPIPLKQTFSIKIRVDTEIEVFKVQARVIELLYKNFIYYFEYNGLRIPAQGSMTDGVGDRTKIFNYSYSSNREAITLTFGLSVETYLPQLDLSTERPRGNLMQAGIKLRTSVGNTITNPDGKEILHGIDQTQTEVLVNYGPPIGASDISLT